MSGQREEDQLLPLFSSFIKTLDSLKNKIILSVNHTLHSFLTDWGHKSYYVGVTKAVIKKINPQVEIIDLTHKNWKFLTFEKQCMCSSGRFSIFHPESIFLTVVDYG